MLKYISRSKGGVKKILMLSCNYMPHAINNYIYIYIKHARSVFF